MLHKIAYPLLITFIIGLAVFSYIKGQEVITLERLDQESALEIEALQDELSLQAAKALAAEKEVIKQAMMAKQQALLAEQEHQEVLRLKSELSQ